MAKRWKKEEITYLRRYAKTRTLLELTERFRIEAEAVEAKLAELGLKTVDGIGAVNLAEDPAVTLCYQRPRRPPAWPYNLFCMIHGRDRDGVQRKVDVLLRTNNLQDRRSCVLFSRRRFKQRGAMYISPDIAAEANVDATQRHGVSV